MPEKRTHDYARNGTSSLHRRHRTAEFKKFLAKIDTQVPDGLGIHPVCDDYGTHKTPAVKTWIAAHPGFTCTSP